MKPEVEKYLYDILTSAEAIVEYIGKKKDFKKYQKNRLLKRAIEREIMIIGEATGRIKKITNEAILKNTKEIIGLRNKVVHAYDNVSDVLIWSIATVHIPNLIKEVKIILKAK